MEPEINPKSFTITQYNTSVSRYLKNKVPSVWVTGIITQLQIRDKITYLTIGEFEEGSTRPRATLQLYLWTSEFESYQQKFSELPTPFKLKAELKVKFLLEADFYIPFGKFQPKIIEVDPYFTLGEIAQTRQKIIKALEAEGLLKKNKALSLSPIPLKIGLITAPGSAAYMDFTTTLLDSGFSFEIFFHPAKMQGDNTEATILLAMGALKAFDMDVLCIIRGGGSKTDLVYFDSEKICREIANYPIPVFTGIGHEIDKSIADMVAFEDKITPTDCAKSLLKTVEEQYYVLEESTQNLKSTWRLSLEDSLQQMQLAGKNVAYRWKARQKKEREQMQYAIKGIKSASRAMLRSEFKNMERQYFGLERGPLKIVRVFQSQVDVTRHRLAGFWGKLKNGEKSKLQVLTREISGASNRYIQAENKQLGLSIHGLHKGIPKILSPALVEQNYAMRQIKNTWNVSFSKSAEELKWKGKIVRQQDPKRNIERGYSLMRNASGKLIVSTADIKSGEEISTQIANGYIRSKVISTSENK